MFMLGIFGHEDLAAVHQLEAVAGRTRTPWSQRDPEARHARVGDRAARPVSALLAEERDDAAAAADDVAVADARENACSRAPA